MRVSVIIPAYNSGPFIVEAVESVLAQTRQPDEIIVVDDGSTDDTQARLATFGDRILRIVKPNGGVASARNHGLDRATGDFIAFLDADDVWHPRKLEIQLSVFEAQPQWAMLGTTAFAWPMPAMPTPNSGVPAIMPLPFERLIVRNLFTTSTVVMRTDMVRAAGKFDETLHGPEDFDLWLRVSRRAPVGVVQTKLAGYRADTPNSLSKNALRMEADTRRIFSKYDEEGVFRGRFLLRQRVLGRIALGSAFMYYAAEMYGPALGQVVKSLVRWPVPFRRAELRLPFGRLRILGASLRRILLPPRRTAELIAT
jgi:glycosyltransferase involved in cell wall biosynthesis